MSSLVLKIGQDLLYFPGIVNIFFHYILVHMSINIHIYCYSSSNYS